MDRIRIVGVISPAAATCFVTSKLLRSESRRVSAPVKKIVKQTYGG
jgi:hypothetical protein